MLTAAYTFTPPSDVVPPSKFKNLEIGAVYNMSPTKQFFSEDDKFFYQQLDRVVVHKHELALYFTIKPDK